MCDIVGLKVDCKTEKGEDGRDRKIYNPIPKTYKVEVILEYYRDKDGDGNFMNDLKVIRTTYTDLITGTTTLLPHCLYALFNGIFGNLKSLG